MKFLPNIDEANVQNYFKVFLKDDQDSVKVQLVDSIIAFGTAYANNNQV